MRSSTATCVVSIGPLAVMVNSTARPFGRTDGKRWSDSPCAVSGVVKAFGSPPAADTRSSPVLVSLVAKIIESSGPQLAPRGAPTMGHSERGGPPATDTFRISPSAPVKKPTQRPSGERNGLRALVMPRNRHGVELIDRPDHQLRITTRRIDEVRAIGGQDEVAIESPDRELLRDRRDEGEAHRLQLCWRRAHQRPRRDRRHGGADEERHARDDHGTSRRYGCRLRDDRGGHLLRCAADQFLDPLARLADVTHPGLGSFFKHAASNRRRLAGSAAGSALQSGSFIRHRRQRDGDVVALECATSGHHLEDDDAERPDVRALVHRLPARLLRRHVRRRAENDPRLRRVHATASASSCAFALDAASGLHRLRETEVEHLHRAVGAHFDVRGLQIAVNDALFVRGFERLGDLLRDGQCLVERDRARAMRCDRSSPSTSSITSAVSPALSSRP